jgi:hypothetical protein
MMMRPTLGLSRTMKSSLITTSGWVARMCPALSSTTTASGASGS